MQTRRARERARRRPVAASHGRIDEGGRGRDASPPLTHSTNGGKRRSEAVVGGQPSCRPPSNRVPVADAGVPQCRASRCGCLAEVERYYLIMAYKYISQACRGWELQRPVGGPQQQHPEEPSLGGTVARGRPQHRFATRIASLRSVPH